MNKILRSIGVLYFLGIFILQNNSYLLQSEMINDAKMRYQESTEISCVEQLFIQKIDFTFWITCFIASVYINSLMIIFAIARQMFISETTTCI